MATGESKDRLSVPAPGAPWWTCRLTGKFLPLLSLYVTVGVPWQVRAEVPLADLVEQAGSPKVFYSQPEQRDSLIALLAESGEARIQDLLCHLDTPWAIHFEVIRRALESIGDPARQAVILELSQNGDTHYVSLLLAVFEKLGQPGDEPILDRYLNSGQRSLIIPAARCLAEFGRFEQSIRLLAPLLADSSAHVRLVAVWAQGKIFMRDSGKRPNPEMADKIRSLLDDPCPQVRFMSAETLKILGLVGEEMPKLLKPAR